MRQIDRQNILNEKERKKERKKERGQIYKRKKERMEERKKLNEIDR